MVHSCSGLEEKCLHPAHTQRGVRASSAAGWGAGLSAGDYNKTQALLCNE